jgi:hypothetical protein
VFACACSVGVTVAIAQSIEASSRSCASERRRASPIRRRDRSIATAPVQRVQSVADAGTATAEALELRDLGVALGDAILRPVLGRFDEAPAEDVELALVVR